MAKLLKMLWENMNLTVLPFFETWSAHIFGGWHRVCWCTNEAFNRASPTKEFWENCPQKTGGHIYGKNEGWAYLRKLLYIVSYPALLETPRTKMTIFQISQATRLSWKIVSLQHCFVKFGCGTDNIFFLQKCKISTNIFYSSIIRVIHILNHIFLHTWVGFITIFLDALASLGSMLESQSVSG